jgi:hypothetical protein
VFNKQIYPFDFTVGLGNGRLGKKVLPASDETFKFEMLNDPRTWWDDSQVFWGIQWAVSKHISLMVEYSQIKYEIQTSDPAQAKYFQKPVPSKYNYGLRWKPYRWGEIDLSYQRGEQVALNFSMNFDIGDPMVPIYEYPYKEKRTDRVKPVYERLEQALYKSGFSNIGISATTSDILIEVQNDRYYYSTKALGVILRIIYEIAPPNLQQIHVVLTRNNIPMIKFDTTRVDLQELYTDKFTLNQFLYVSKINTL